jgi:hypothetical protein
LVQDRCRQSIMRAYVLNYVARCHHSMFLAGRVEV